MKNTTILIFAISLIIGFVFSEIIHILKDVETKTSIIQGVNTTPYQVGDTLYLDVIDGGIITINNFIKALGSISNRHVLDTIKVEYTDTFSDVLEIANTVDTTIIIYVENDLRIKSIKDINKWNY